MVKAKREGVEMTQEIRFSPWVNWVNRNSCAGKGKKDIGGVYLFARFEHEPPPAPADPLEKSVVYIGQSSRRTFKSRWNPFDRALKNPRKAKGRAKRYIDLFGPDPSPPYVATLPVQELVRAFLKIGCSCSLLDLDASGAEVGNDFLDEIDDLLVKYMERRLILLCAAQHGHRPVLNKD